MSITSAEDTDFAESDGEYDPECDSHLDMRMEDDVDNLDSIDLDGKVDIERDPEDEEDEQEEDKEEEDEKDEDVMAEDEEEDEDED
jgi:hypothetical protein